MAFFVSRGQKVRFTGKDAEKRARKYAQEYDGSCEADGDTVTFTRDTNISPHGLTLRDVLGPNVVPFQSNGAAREIMPPRGKRHIKRRFPST